MVEPGGHYAKWNKPVTEVQPMTDSTYTVKLTEAENRNVTVDRKVGNGELFSGYIVLQAGYILDTCGTPVVVVNNIVWCTSFINTVDLT